MITTTYYKRDPKSRKRKVSAGLIGVPEELAGLVTDSADDALKNEEGLPVIACVVMRGDDDGTD